MPLHRAIAYSHRRKTSHFRGTIDEKLPCELLCAVFEHVSFADRVRCTRVSRRWRDILLHQEWPGMWRSIELGDQPTIKVYESESPGVYYTAPTNGLPEWLARVPTGLLQHFTFVGKEASGSAMMQILSEKRFSHLKELRLICPDNQTVYGHALGMDILMSSQSSLEWLELGRFMILDETDDSWTKLLSNLPKLTHLKFKFPVLNYRNRDYTIHIAPTRPLTALTHLHWDSYHRVSLSTLLPQCPHLQYIIISSTALRDDTCKTGTLLDIVKESCPRLKCLEVPEIQSNDYHYTWDGHFTAAKPGLEKLVVHWDDGVTEGQLGNVILDHGETLNFLDLSIIDDDAYHGLENLESHPVSFPMMQTLRIGHFGYAPPRPILFACPLISHSHHLRLLSLTNLTCNPIDLLQALKSCPELSALELTSVRSSYDDEGEEDSPSFDDMPQVNLPCLVRLVATWSSLVNDTFLQHLNPLETLTDVTISECTGVTDRGQKEFIAKARHHSKGSSLMHMMSRIRNAVHL
ncbi:hypothetical protein BCR43DRAFT_484158 [Syncephalastrum racemosum]|uniref:F-box domain-containing protein n=1 Tax=Syncephalastrum racemosum TaxID=13706 RepID=A0A1X2HWC8_SYNRA|nr:hypothetical protein BCR43DRAFT_484158 [Syncephalastrum racemosum]